MKREILFFLFVLLLINQSCISMIAPAKTESPVGHKILDNLKEPLIEGSESPIDQGVFEPLTKFKKAGIIEETFTIEEIFTKAPTAAPEEARSSFVKTSEDRGGRYVWQKKYRLSRYKKYIKRDARYKTRIS